MKLYQTYLDRLSSANKVSLTGNMEIQESQQANELIKTMPYRTFMRDENKKLVSW